MADLVEMKSAIAQMQEQMRELMLAMHQLNLPTQATTRIAESGDVEMIGASTISTPSHASPPIVQHPTSCLLYTSPSPRDRQKSRMPSSA